MIDFVAVVDDMIAGAFVVADGNYDADDDDEDDGDELKMYSMMMIVHNHNVRGEYTFHSRVLNNLSQLIGLIAVSDLDSSLTIVAQMNTIGA